MADHRLVRVRGTVTFISNQPSLLFIQDATGGIAAIGPRDPAVRRQLRPGVMIEVEGVPTAGRSSNFLLNKPKEVLAISLPDGVPPQLILLPPKPVTIAELTTSTKYHGDLIETQGVVRTVRLENIAPTQQDALVMTVVAGGARLEAVYLIWSPTAQVPNNWVGATVRLKGVFNSAGPDKPTTGVMRLLLQGKLDAQVVTSTSPVASSPPTPLASLISAEEENFSPQIRAGGVVTLTIPAKGFYLQDDSAGLWVDAAGAVLPKPGDALDLLGFSGKQAGVPRLENAVWKITGRANPPAAPAITADQALSGDFDSRLVSLDALILEVSRLNEGPTLVLQNGERVFLGRLADPAEGQLPVAENSWVHVTGVCVNNRLADRSGPDARPISFHLMLPSTSAIKVIHAPGWWTLEKVLIGTAAVLVLALASIAWVIALRRRVTEQTVQIRQHIHEQALSEERMRIARELHDSLEQDLLGITMQLKATEKLLDRPERARESLTLASAMVRRSQAETHRAVWDLRERKTGQGGLITTLRSAVAGLTSGPGGNGTAGGGPTVEVLVSGDERDLSPQTENHLLRVALEAVTNAFKHANATRVGVSVAFEPKRVRVEVVDNGKGFDASNLPAPVTGHFGLFGMKERASKLNGELQITSSPGDGSLVRLVVPEG